MIRLQPLRYFSSACVVPQGLEAQKLSGLECRPEGLLHPQTPDETPPEGPIAAQVLGDENWVERKPKKLRSAVDSTIIRSFW
jgi:hypothetical protein